MLSTALPFVSAILAWATLLASALLARRSKDLLPGYIGVLTQPFRLDLQLQLFTRHAAFVALTASLPVQVLVFFGMNAPLCGI